MFPTDLAYVVLIIGLMFFSFVSNKALMYILTGFVIMFMNFQDTTNGSETLIMFLIAFVMIYYGVTKKEF